MISKQNNTFTNRSTVQSTSAQLTGYTNLAFHDAFPTNFAIRSSPQSSDSSPPLSTKSAQQLRNSNLHGSSGLDLDVPTYGSAQNLLPRKRANRRTKVYSSGALLANHHSIDQFFINSTFTLPTEFASRTITFSRALDAIKQLQNNAARRLITELNPLDRASKTPSQVIQRDPKTNKPQHFLIVSLNHSSSTMFDHCVFLQNLLSGHMFLGKTLSVPDTSSKKHLKKERKIWNKLQILQEQPNIKPVASLESTEQKTNNEETINEQPTSDEKSLNQEESLISSLNITPSLLGSVELNKQTHCLLTHVQPSIRLRALLSDCRPFPKTEVCPLAAQLCSALAFLHSNRILHRNLRPEVITITWDGRLKFTDLSSLVKQPTGPLASFTTSSKNAPMNDEKNSYMSIYTAPEVLLGKSYSIVSDWWSLGVIIYEMLTGSAFLHGTPDWIKIAYNDSCKQAVQELLLKSFTFPTFLTKDSIDFLKLFLQKLPEKRFKWTISEEIAQIKKHEFFDDFDWSSKKLWGEIQMQKQENLNKIWTLDCMEVLHTLGDNFGPFLRDRHLIMPSPLRASQNLHSLLQCPQKLHPQLAVLKLVWKTKMRSHRNGWRKIMNERLAWQKLSASACSFQCIKNSHQSNFLQRHSLHTETLVTPKHHLNSRNSLCSINSENSPNSLKSSLKSDDTRQTYLDNKLKHEQPETSAWSAVTYCCIEHFTGPIVPLYEFMESEACYGFVSGYLPNTCALSQVIYSAPLPETLVKVISAQIALTISLCHTKGVLLRGLSSHSFLVDADCNVFLADLSHAKLCDWSTSSKQADFGVEYWSPERIQNQPYGREADWYVLGVLLFEFHFGHTPFRIYCERKGIQLKVDNKGALYEKPPTDLMLRAYELFLKLITTSSMSIEMQSLILDLVQMVPQKRLGHRKNTIEKLQSYAFFRNFNWKRYTLNRT